MGTSIYTANNKNSSITLKNTLNIEVLDKHSRTNVSLDPRMILLLIIAVELYYNSLVYMYN